MGRKEGRKKKRKEGKKMTEGKINEGRMKDE